MKVIFLLFSTLVSFTAAFVELGRPAVHPQLKKFAEDYLGKLVNLRLDIQDRLSLQGPIVKFLDNANSKDLEVIKPGYVIDLDGMRNINFKEGHWQMTWNEGSNSGRVICEFDLPEPVSHSDAYVVANCRTSAALPHPPSCLLHCRFNAMTSRSPLAMCT